MTLLSITYSIIGLVISGILLTFGRTEIMAYFQWLKSNLQTTVTPPPLEGPCLTDLLRIVPKHNRPLHFREVGGEGRGEREGEGGEGKEGLKEAREKERDRKEEKKGRKKGRARAVLYRSSVTIFKMQILLQISQRGGCLTTPEVILKPPGTCRQLWPATPDVHPATWGEGCQHVAEPEKPSKFYFRIPCPCDDFFQLRICAVSASGQKFPHIYT